MAILAEVIFTGEGQMKKMSLVKNPAVEVNYLKMNKDEKPLTMSVDEEKQEITGVALIPKKKYYRGADYFGGEEDGYIFFSEETVKAIGMDFINNGNNAINLEHETDVEQGKISLVQSWFVESTNDKIYSLGFSAEEVPLGSWCITERINDIELWDMVKLNTNGYSIEGKFPTRVLAEGLEMSKKLTDDEVVDAIVEIIKNDLN